MTADKYDVLLELLGFKSTQYKLSAESIDRHYEGACELAEEIGIKISYEDQYSLVLWNDEVNDMIHVVLALYEVCKLSNEDAMRVMLKAHKKGKSIAKIGTYKEMDSMRAGLNKRNLTASIHLSKS